MAKVFGLFASGHLTPKSNPYIHVKKHNISVGVLTNKKKGVGRFAVCRVKSAEKYTHEGTAVVHHGFKTDMLIRNELCSHLWFTVNQKCSVVVQSISPRMYKQRSRRMEKKTRCLLNTCGAFNGYLTGAANMC